MPFLPVNCSSIAVAIGDMRMGQYSGQSATELDSHANMAVAGTNVSIISKSGLKATVTPFSPDLSAMDDVEIGDVAMAYDDPFNGVTYILVMRNALLIPTMNHNLKPYSSLSYSRGWIILG